MSFSIRFDYRYDNAGFFDDPDRRAALEAAAAEWEAILQDDFSDVPAGTVFSIRNPTSLAIETVTLSEAIDDILVFVGARPFASTTLAIASPDGGDASGDAFAARISRDFRNMGPVTDFEPWAGSISFNSEADWSFDTNGPVSGRSDFMSVALHELGHVLGIGTSGAFDLWVVEDHFTGPNALRLANGQPIPLENDHAHVEEGYADDSVALDPILTNGTRVLISDVDKAILADIGYQIAGFQKQGDSPSLATDFDERVFGTIGDDRIDGLSGDDSLQGADGNDHLIGGPGKDELFGESGNDTLDGGSGDDYIDGGAGDDILSGGPGADIYFGHGGRDIFVIAAGDGSNRLSDFDLATDVIKLIDSGFASEEHALSAISKPFNNVSRLTLTDGTTVDVFHASQGGTPLTNTHIMLESTDQGEIGLLIAGDPTNADTRIVLDERDGTNQSNANVLIGSAMDDAFTVGASDVRVDGLEGVDIVRFSGNQSSYTVALGGDGVTVTHRMSGAETIIGLRNIELIDFETRDPMFSSALDLRFFGSHSTLDQASLDRMIELYIAYFDRAPDAIGLGFWASAYGKGTPLETIAVLFAEQNETALLYPEDLNTLRFVSDVYENVLGRTPDWDGLQFWSTALDNGAVDRSEFILELLTGAQAALPNDAGANLISRQIEDQMYLNLKTDLGAYFALDRGLSDISAATQIMSVFDGSRASFDAAMALTETIYVEASDPENGAFLMPIVGISTDANMI